MHKGDEPHCKLIEVFDLDPSDVACGGFLSNSQRDLLQQH